MQVKSVRERQRGTISSWVKQSGLAGRESAERWSSTPNCILPTPEYTERSRIRMWYIELVWLINIGGQDRLPVLSFDPNSKVQSTFVKAADRFFQKDVQLLLDEQRVRRLRHLG